MTQPPPPVTGGTGHAGQPIPPSARRAAPARRSFWRRFSRQRLPFVAFVVLVLFILVAIFATWVAPHDPASQELSQALQGPSGSHWLGTDEVGRDTLSRLIAGTRLTGIAMLEAIVVALVIGVPLGLLAGYFGGVGDWLVARLNDILLALPSLIIVFAVVAVWGPSLSHAMIALGVVFSTRYIAIGRAMVGAAREETYVASAKVIGLRSIPIIVRHIMPNVVRPFIVQTSVLLGAIILVEAELSYLGLSAPAGSPDWGRTLRDAQNYVLQQPLLPLMPGIAITIVVLALNLAGDGFADAVSGRLDLTAAPAAQATRRAVQPPVEVAEREPAADALEIADAILAVKGLEVAFPAADGSWCNVVDGASFALRPGETLGLVGESGCGKSMTVLAAMGLVPSPGRIVSGSVRLAGSDLVGASERALRAIRGNDIAVVFQEPTSALNPATSIGRQIAEPVRAHLGLDRKAARERAAELLHLVGVPDPRRRLSDYPHQLSGGIAQRVAIARALACDPKVLLADEPTTALDVTIQGQVLDLLADLRERLGMAVLFVTHDVGVAADICDRVAVMYAGEIVETGTVEQVLTGPRHPYTAALLAAVPANERRTGRLATIPGRVPPPAEWDGLCRFRSRCAFADEECRTHPVALSTEPHAVRCLHSAALRAGGRL